MSGHSDFTWWVEHNAKHAIHNDEIKKIKNCYFTSNSDGIPNSDVFVIVFTDKSTSNDFENISLKDLRKRFNKTKK